MYDNPKHAHYGAEGEPHKEMLAGATGGDTYEFSLRRLCPHYKMCLAQDVHARRERELVLLQVFDVRAYSVQFVLWCGTNNAESAAAARELFEERYRRSTHRQVATGLIKGLFVCTNCVGALDGPAEFGDPSV